MIGIPEIVVILVMGLLGLVPIVILVWLIVRIVQIGTQQQTLEQRIRALERAGQQNR